MIVYLHTHGADLMANDNAPLILAVKNGSVNLVKYIHEHGADLTARNNAAIHKAVKYDNSEVVKYLLDTNVYPTDVVRAIRTDNSNIQDLLDSYDQMSMTKAAR